MGGRRYGPGHSHHSPDHHRHPPRRLVRLTSLAADGRLRRLLPEDDSRPPGFVLREVAPRDTGRQPWAAVGGQHPGRDRCLERRVARRRRPAGVPGPGCFPATWGYAHFQFSDYAKLTVIGVLIACAAWPVVTRISLFSSSCTWPLPWLPITALSASPGPGRHADPPAGRPSEPAARVRQGLKARRMRTSAQCAPDPCSGP
jgi:hypothetical protein